MDWITPGRKAGLKVLKGFIEHKLARYDERRNDPNADGQSNLSPYLHFGQVGAQEAALAVVESEVSEGARETFLEEMIVRPELSDNFCHHNPLYDRVEGFPNRARKTLDEHRDDDREYLYSLEELEDSLTHDALWNAAQREMVTQGKMHGYMRMYWAMKIPGMDRVTRTGPGKNVPSSARSVT